MRELGIVLAAVLVCGTLLIACDNSTQETSSSAAATLPTSAPPSSSPPPTSQLATTTSPAPATTPPPATTTTLGTPDVVTIDVTVRDGEVAGPGRVVVAVGAQIRLTVMSHEADEVHFHGYDVYADVAPGSPARLIVTADIPGVFEVELEGAGLELVLVEVK